MLVKESTVVYTDEKKARVLNTLSVTEIADSDLSKFAETPADETFEGESTDHSTVLVRALGSNR